MSKSKDNSEFVPMCCLTRCSKNIPSTHNGNDVEGGDVNVNVKPLPSWRYIAMVDPYAESSAINQIGDIRDDLLKYEDYGSAIRNKLNQLKGSDHDIDKALNMPKHGTVEFKEFSDKVKALAEYYNQTNLTEEAKELNINNHINKEVMSRVLEIRGNSVEDVYNKFRIEANIYCSSKGAIGNRQILGIYTTFLNTEVTGDTGAKAITVKALEAINKELTGGVSRVDIIQLSSMSIAERFVLANDKAEVIHGLLTTLMSGELVMGKAKDSGIVEGSKSRELKEAEPSLESNYNKALFPTEAGKGRSTGNYQPYMMEVAVRVESIMTVGTIVSSPKYGEAISKSHTSIFKTGKMNPRIVVEGFGHFVQGITIGDVLDIRPSQHNNMYTPRPIMEGCDDYDRIHSKYHARNPILALSIKAADKQAGRADRDTYTKAIKEQGDNKDRDKPTDEVVVVFKGLIDAGAIAGIYRNRTDV